MPDEHKDEMSYAVKTRVCDGDEVIVPLATEEISVSKRIVPTGRVQVSRVTRQREEIVDELLSREHIEVERIAVGEPVDAMPAVREEGDTIVIPIVEEVLTIERRLVLKEEVRIRKVRKTERYEERVTLRKQEAEVARLPVKNSTPGGR
jgi:uncharacterized protein (TIGR02271 family)